MDLFVLADYPVQLDTGSSDLWIQSPVNPNNPLPNSNQTVRLSLSQLLLGTNSFGSLQHTISPWALLIRVRVLILTSHFHQVRHWLGIWLYFLCFN
jgi:hypothetical protein